MNSLVSDEQTAGIHDRLSVQGDILLYTSSDTYVQ